MRTTADKVSTFPAVLEAWRQAWKRSDGGQTTVADLAVALNIDPGSLGQILRGRRPLPVKRCRDVATTFGLPLDVVKTAAGHGKQVPNPDPPPDPYARCRAGTSIDLDVARRVEAAVVRTRAPGPSAHLDVNAVNNLAAALRWQEVQIERDIRAMREDAQLAGETRLVEQCDLALEGDARARTFCETAWARILASLPPLPHEPLPTPLAGVRAALLAGLAERVARPPDVATVATPAQSDALLTVDTPVETGPAAWLIRAVVDVIERRAPKAPYTGLYVRFRPDAVHPPLPHKVYNAGRPDGSTWSCKAGEVRAAQDGEHWAYLMGWAPGAFEPAEPPAEPERDHLAETAYAIHRSHPNRHAGLRDDPVPWGTAIRSLPSATLPGLARLLATRDDETIRALAALVAHGTANVRQPPPG